VISCFFLTQVDKLLNAPRRSPVEISVESSNECKCMKRMIHLVQDRSPVEISVESSIECKCMMRMIHLVQDRSPVEVTSEYRNECLIPIRDGKFLY
jgi:hypothetical protein